MKTFRQIVLFVVVWIAVFTVVAWVVPYDDTDNAFTGERSGVELVTDHGTGCQYLKGLFGGITPRLGRGGEHVGCRR